MNRAELVVVAVEDIGGVLTRVEEHLRFCPAHAVAVAEVFEVAAADDRQHADGGLYHARKPLHLAEAGDTHFDDSRLRVLGHREQRQGNAQLVVEVALRLVCSEFLREHSIEHFLCRGFAHAARHADDRDVEFLAVRLGDVLDRVEGRRNEDIGLLRVCGSLLAEGADRALFVAFFDEIVAVHSAALDREKEGAVFDLTAVTLDGGNARGFHFLAADVLTAARRGDFL